MASLLNGSRILVTGGCGFLGSHVVRLLSESGAHVRVFDLVTREMDAGIEVIKGNLLNMDDLRAAIKDCDAVCHIASPNPTSNNADLFMKVNVGGTKNVIEVCREMNAVLVYTSSASVIYDGTDQCGLDETIPYPESALDAYANSKMLAEKEVLTAGELGEVLACALRPHGIFGPRDPHLVPALAKAGAAGKSKYIVGDGSNIVDFTYVVNVAYSHVLALDKLMIEASERKGGSRNTSLSKDSISGHAFFITNDEPMQFWTMMARIYQGLGYPLPRISMPMPLMVGVGKICDYLGKLGLKTTFNSQRVMYAGRHHYYNCDKAKRMLGYKPIVRLSDAITTTLASFEELKNKDEPKVPLSKSEAQDSTFRLLALLFASVFFPIILLGWTSCTMNCIASHPLLFGSLAILFLLLSKAWGSNGILFQLLSVQESSLQKLPKTGYPSKVSVETQRLNGKLAVVTGGNRGIGYQTALAFAQQGADVIICCRKQTQGDDACQSILAECQGSPSVTAMVMDLASVQSVDKFVQSFRAKNVSIDYLINNAGVMATATTPDGLDTQFHCNFLGHFQLTTALLGLDTAYPSQIADVTNAGHKQVPSSSSSRRGGGGGETKLSEPANDAFSQELFDFVGSQLTLDRGQGGPGVPGQASDDQKRQKRQKRNIAVYGSGPEDSCFAPGARIVNLSSAVHKAHCIDLDDIETNSRGLHSTVQYATTKLMNILLTNYLTRVVSGSGIVVNSVHPGVVVTNFFAHFLPNWLSFLAPYMKHLNACGTMLEGMQGAQASLHAAELRTSSNYIDQACQYAAAHPAARNYDLISLLAERSFALLDQKRK